MAQKERENFYRNSTVIVDHGKESLSAVLENDLTNTKLTFEDFINRHQHDIYHLCYNKSPCCQCPTGRFVPANKSRILYPGQLDLLLDTSGSTLNGHNPNTSQTLQHCCRPAKQSLSTSNLDITLLRCLLMNFALNCQTNHVLTQDIEDLVRYRNTLFGHAKDARLTDSDYAKYKTDVEGIILRIARFCNIENEMRQKLNDATQRPLDESILLQYQNKLIEQSEYENNIEEKFDEVKQQLILHDERLHSRMDTMERKFGEIGHRKRNIIAHAEARLSEHSQDDTFIDTGDAKTCCKILEKYKTVIIIAKAGGGKSKTCLQIATMYQENSYAPMLFVNDEILRNRDLINFHDQNIVIVEDLFGKSNIEFNDDIHTGILDILNSCIQNESCKSKLIITIRGNKDLKRNLKEKHIFLKKYLFFNLDKNRSSQSNELILTKHMNKHGISLCKCIQWIRTIDPCISTTVVRQCESEVFETNDNSLQICVKLFNEICSGNHEMHIGFPQACHLFCSNNNFTKQGIDYFTHASQSLVNEFLNFKIQGFDNKLMQYQYCALVYTAIKNSIHVDDFDETFFQRILSYFENQTIKMSLLKEAIRKLDGTYINKRCLESGCNQAKRQKVSDIYVLQHNTIREAILLSYGEDADVLPFCDLVFLCEYIRPKGYKHSFGDQMVFIFCDYKHVASKLISMLSTDDITFTIVGCYLERVALLHRRDEMIKFFFQNLKNVEPNEYACLLDGLTSLGTNPALIKFHPNLCKTIMIHAGMKVFNAFCRPIGWTEDDSNFVEIETNLLMNKLYYIIDTSSLKESEKYKIGVLYYINCCDSNSSRYVVGNYVFENLITKGFLSIVECLFENLKQNLQKIIPIYVKEFLDGLLDKGKRSCIVSQFKPFCEAVLFKYGSIPTVLELCIPLTSTIINPNLIKVDDRLLTGKLSAHLESSCEMELGLEARLPAVNREDGAYFVYWDNDYIKRKYINLMTEYFLEHGFQSNNEKFVRTMYEQFVSGKYGDESVNDDSKSCLDNGQNNDKVENDWAAKYTKVIFNEYPGDEIWVDEIGEIAYVSINNRFVKKVFREKNPILYIDTMCARLFLFLNNLEPYLKAGMNTYSRRMTLLQLKFYSLFKNCSK